MSERLGANGMPMKEKDESSEMISEILEVNPNKKKKKKPSNNYEWSSNKENDNEEL
jgi:hypothetical protein